MHSIKTLVGDLPDGPDGAAGEGDYTDAEGYLVCGKCRTRKQLEVQLPAFGGRPARVQRVPVNCHCMQQEVAEEYRRREQRALQARIDLLRREGITDPACARHRFEQDDGAAHDVTALCRRYVDHWAEMRDSNTGMLLYGSVGTGKSYMACCIANALLDKGISACVTSFPRILAQLQRAFDGERGRTVDRLQRYELLVIDDLGVERDTAYALEQVYAVIDARARAAKPLIVTTNLSPTDLQTAADLGRRRIYDRVLELCPIQVKLAGPSRRTQIAADKRQAARRLLGLEDGPTGDGPR
ncbi:MAG: ATP-binding protein [Clostridiales bacterium]|nr:ATP-binding protein [Clostridiales bacterium]